MISMTVAGNVGRDAQLRRTQGGDPVLGFSVAVDMGKNKNGNRLGAVWVNCSIWGKRAESLETYITKGTKLVLTGRPGVNVYEGKGSLALSVSDLTFMGRSQQQRSDDDRGGYDDPPPRDDLDSDIPF